MGRAGASQRRERERVLLAGDDARSVAGWGVHALLPDARQVLRPVVWPPAPGLVVAVRAFTLNLHSNIGERVVSVGSCTRWATPWTMVRVELLLCDLGRRRGRCRHQLQDSWLL